MLKKWISQADISFDFPVTQVYGVLMNHEGKYLIIFDGEKYNLPGGKPEYGETFEETLCRECLEEAQVNITDLRLLGAQKVDGDPFHDNQNILQLRYWARIVKVNSSAIDVDSGVLHERVFVEASRINEFLKWGEIGDQMVSALMELDQCWHQFSIFER